MNWLFLRGLGRWSKHWHQFPKEFESHVPGSKVRCLDLAGAGTEHARRSPASIRGMVEDLRSRWLELSKEKTNWGVLGLSLGGMVGLQWARDFPEDFSHVVVINSSDRSNGVFDRMNRKAFWELMVAGGTKDFFEREKKILRLTTSLNEEKIGEYAQLAKEFFRETPMKKRNFLRQLFAAMRFQLDGRVASKTLILCSKADRMVRPKCSASLANFLGAEIRFHPSGGHDLALDDPSWIGKQVEAWIKDQEAQS